MQSLNSSPYRVIRSFIFLMLMCFYTRLHAQKTEVGQACPDPLLSDVLHYKKGVLKLSSLRPRLVILDFWNTHCLACITAFPHLDSLQQKFGDRIQIILVNSESKEVTLAFFARRKKLFMPTLPMITGDTKLIKAFSREGYPYSVWIDGKGIVRFITSGYNTTEAHIQQMLDNEAPALSRAAKINYVSWLTEESWKDDVQFFSALAPRKDRREVGNSISPVNEGRGMRFCQTAPPLDLLKTAFAAGRIRMFDWKGSTDVAVRDSVAFKRPADANLLDDWNQRYWYNYELVVPASRRGDLYTMMQEELCRYFDVTAHWEKRMITGLALVRIPVPIAITYNNHDTIILCNTNAANRDTIIAAVVKVNSGHQRNISSNYDTTDRLRTAGGPPSGKLTPYYDEVPAEGSMRTLVNKPFSELISVLTTSVERMARLPFADETGYSGSIDISLPWKVIESFHLEDWRAALRKYGLDLVEKPLEVNVLVIRDR